MTDENHEGAGRRAPAFPQPIRMSGRNFWRLGTIRRYVAEVAGEGAPPAQADDEHLLTARAVRTRLGNVSAMWLHRRMREAGEHEVAKEATAP